MIINVKSQTELAGFYLIYEGSTLLERPGLRGASHLLEHLMCKSFDHMQDELQNHCVNWNAYTGVNDVTFLLTGLETEVNLFRRKLTEALKGFAITQEQFDNEKKIVLQEYKDTFASRYWTHIHNVDRHRFSYCNPIGYKDDLEALTLDQLRKFWEDWFTGPTKIISVSDRYMHFDSRKMPVVTVTESPLRSYQDTTYRDETAPWLEPVVQTEDNCVMLLQTEPIREDVPALKVAMRALSSGLNSPLYQEAREKRGLCYGVWLGGDRYNEEYLLNLTANVAMDKVKELAKVCLEVLADPDKYVTDERVELARNEMMISDKIEAVNRYGDVTPWTTPARFQARAVQETVTPEEIRRVIKQYLSPEKLTLWVDRWGYSDGVIPTL